MCVSSLCVCVCASLCIGSGSMCVRVRGEVSLGWPWLESWRRAEVKEEICRKDTHHFPHYYFFFFFFYFYVFVSHSFFFCPRFFSPLPLPLPSHFLLCVFFATVFLTRNSSPAADRMLKDEIRWFLCSYCLCTKGS